MRSRLIFIASGLLVLFMIGYLGSPYLAVRNLKGAAESHDADSLESSVDFPAVRDSLKSELNSALVRKMSADTNPLVGLGLMMVPAIVDRMVDSFVTPDGIAALAQGQKPNEPATEAKTRIEYSYDWVNLDRFRVRMRNAEQAKAGPSLLFERRGLFSWKLIRIEIADLINDAPAIPSPSTAPGPSLEPTMGPTPVVPTPITTLSTTINSSASDEDLKEQWNGLNEECRGGQHSPEDEICSGRDKVETALQGRDWCWTYSDPAIAPADYRWHRCEAARP